MCCHKKVILKYVLGNYPTTMQMYFDKYDQKLYDEVYNQYLAKYYKHNHQHEFNYQIQDGDKYYLNFSAFIILDKNNKIKAYAFDDFNDLAWIFKVISIDGLELDLEQCVYDQVKEDIKQAGCFKVE